MKVLYLFNRVRKGLDKEIFSGQDHDGHFFGMFRLGKHGIRAEYLEIEDFFSARFAKFIRNNILNVHYIHLPFFLKMRRYDIIFSSTALGSLFLKTVLGLTYPRWVVFDYGIKSMIGSGQTTKQKIFKYMIAKVDGVIAISPGEKRAMINLFPHMSERIEYIPLGVDISFFKPDFMLEEEGFILSPGRDSGRDLLTLVAATKDLGYQVKVTAWPGNIEKLGISAEYLKRCDLSPTELREEYRRARIIVLPLDTKNGLNDAMGCSTLVEAMAMGKAIIATQTETMSAYITHGENGWLVPEGDAGLLREAVVKLMNDHELRRQLGRAARDFVVNNCSADIFASRLAAYFKNNFSENKR